MAKIRLNTVQKWVNDYDTRLTSLIEDIENAIIAIEEEIEDIEPYENKEWLTEAQEERKDRLEVYKDYLQYTLDYLNNAMEDLAYIVSEE